MDQHNNAQELSDRIVLSNGNDSGVFFRERPGIFSGHYLFKDARGRAAISLATSMLSDMFYRYDAKVIIGATPVTNRPAAWVSRQLGFRDYGQVEQADVGLVTLFVLTKDDFEKE